MLKIIKDLDFFTQVEGSKLESLLPSVRVKGYTQSEIMRYEEDDVSRIYFLLTGEAKLYKVIDMIMKSFYTPFKPRLF